MVHHSSGRKVLLHDDAAEEVLAHVRAIRDAASPKDAMRLCLEFAECFGREFSAAVVGDHE
jgi:hypothetical protein